MSQFLFKNARIITPLSIQPGSVHVVDGKIAAVRFSGKEASADPPPGQGYNAGGSALDTDAQDLDAGIRAIDAGKQALNAGIQVIDAKGRYLAPGFIDIHTHGAGNADFMDNSMEAIYQACRTHQQYGTTSILPTTITSTRQNLFDFIDRFNGIDLAPDGLPNILGLHLEGPYFTMNQKGAQDPRYLRNPDPDEYEAVIARTDRILRWSFAVELPGSREFLQFLRDKGIISSLAHSDATCAEVTDAYENGLSCLTHFYSAMSTVVRRNAYRIAGAIEAGYLIDDLYVEAIADGRHLPKELLQLIYKVKGADRICLVTDSMRGAGMPEGSEAILGDSDSGMKVIIEDQVAKLMDRTAFAGSVATADRLVRTFRDLTGAPLYEVVRMLTLTPARMLRLEDRKGSISEGKDADLILFDDDIRVSLVMVRGQIHCQA